jgi:exopolysaccharide production protein ExoZ
MEWLFNKFELSRGGHNHVHPMEGLRGFAVFLVFLVHYATLSKPWLDGSPELVWFTQQIFVIGNAGVDLFFVLSGYLIYGSLISRPQKFLPYLSRRIERIYPAFLVVFFIYLILNFLFPAENKIPSDLPQRIIYILANLLLLPGLFPIDPLITVAWSLSYEFFYYLAIPFLIKLLNLYRWSPRARLILYLYVSLAIMLICITGGGPIRLIMFISGILLYEVIKNQYVTTPSSILALMFLIAGLLVKALPFYGALWLAVKTGALFVSFFVLCFCCFAQPTAWLPRIFSWTPIRWLGNISYSYYLIHGLTLKAVFLALGKLIAPGIDSAWLFVALLPIAFAVTLIPSALLFLSIERPFSLAPSRRKKTLTASQVLPMASENLPACAQEAEK